MPVIAGLPVLSQPPDPGPDPFADTRTLAFRSLDGTNLLPFTGDEFIAMWGMQGMDVPPRDVALDYVQGMDGARITDVNIAERKVTLPIWFGSDSSHLAYLDRRDGLRSLFDHRGVNLRTDEGSFDLVANSRAGDQERTLRCLYASGMDGDWTQDSSGVFWEAVGLQLIAVRTYWYGQRWATPVLFSPTDASWFGGFPPTLSASQVIGENIPVKVTGQIESWAQVDITGPATSVLITGPGLRVSIPAGVATGETATVVTDPRGRTATFNGVVDWSRIGPSTRWRPLSPGDQSISVVMSGVTQGATGSSVIISGDSRYEAPW